MSQAANRLALVMQMLDITGNNLANALGIDPSLISKWKTNKRQLPGRPDTVRKIAVYLLKIDEEQQGRALNPLLAALCKGEVATPDELTDLLARWLLETDQTEWFPDIENSIEVRLDTNSYISTIEVFSGLAGRKIATLNFMDKIMSLPSERKLLLLSMEGIDWIDDDATFREQFQNRLSKWVATGHQVETIHWIDRKPEYLQSVIKNWLPRYLDLAIKSWYSPVYEQPQLPFTLFVVPGEAALQGSMTDWSTENCHTILFSDQATVRQCEWLFRKTQGNCLRLVEHVLPWQSQQIVQHFTENWLKIDKKIISLHSSLPFIIWLPKDSLNLIMDENNLCASSRERLLRQWATYSSSQRPGRPAGHRVRLIYHFDATERMLGQKEYIDPMLSLFTGQPVKVRVQFLQELLLAMASSVLEDSSYEIALVRSDISNRLVWPNFLIVSSTFLSAWGDQPELNQLFLREANLVHAFGLYFNDVWKHIPSISRDRQVVAERLAEMAGF